MKIIHGYGAISKWHKRRKSEDFLPQLLWWYHANFVIDEIMIPCQLSTFNFFRVHLKCFNVLWFGPRNTINPGSLLVNYILTKNTLKRAATWAIGPGLFGPFFSIGASMFIFLVKLITNLWFTQISKNLNFNYSNLKTNGTNRKFIIFLKLMALTESL